MPRNLPWLQPQGPKTPTEPPPSKKRRITTSPYSSSDDLPGLSRNEPSHPTHRRNVQNLRSPSTSPPPAPPKQEFMRTGLDQDDAWIMVEDEFEATAQLFTLHLHQAEYRRQKELARRREEALGGADEIARPVVGGGLSTEAQKKKAVGLQKKKVQQAKQQVEEGDEDEEEEDIIDPWVGTQLAGLMMSPRKRDALPAKGMAEGRSNTRAAAGFDRKKPVGKMQALKSEKKREEVVESTDDDLDAPRRAVSKPPPPRVRQPASAEREVSPPAVPRSRHRAPEKSVKVDHVSKNSTSSEKVTSKPASRTLTAEVPVRHVSSTTKTKVRIEPEPEDFTPIDLDMGFPSIPQFTASQGGSVLARRREARLKREKEEKEKVLAKDTMHELPTFLF